MYQDELYNGIDSIYSQIVQTQLHNLITVSDLFDSISYSLDQELQDVICSIIYRLTHNLDHHLINAERFAETTFREINKNRSKEDLVYDNQYNDYELNQLMYIHEKTIKTIDKEYESKEEQTKIFKQLHSGIAFDTFRFN